MTFLAGYKTYIIMALGVAAAAYGYATGSMTEIQAIIAALGALGLGTLRNGQTTETTKVVEKVEEVK